MRGYLNLDANEKFKALGGWCDTVTSCADEDGYRIFGRLKRFAKVSGEMVSLTAIEDALAEPSRAWVAVPGCRARSSRLDKGEVLIAVTNEPKVTLEQIRTTIRAKGLTNLCVPREIKVVREIPKLGTGKVNHRELAATLAKAEQASKTKGPAQKTLDIRNMEALMVVRR
jgi:acyl-[acyl-carrier-protein]-phospholipid O-acyltransferase/long-chain-fatty-acid--[acyl-carrier-protein] ligase